MKQVTECKKRVRCLLRKHGYKKTSLTETDRNSSKVYYYYDGILTVIVNSNLSFAFGEDKVMNCSAHVCAGDTDLNTLYYIAEQLFIKFLSGQMTEEEIYNYVRC